MPWFSIFYSPQWLSFDPRGDPAQQKQKNAGIELVPLREALLNLASRYGLIYNGEPATWAMQTIVETLRSRARYPNSKIRKWVHDGLFSEEYPALTEEGWIKPRTGEPEEELFPIRILIQPKQPGESYKAFEKRFNEACKTDREEYIRGLRAAKWRRRPPMRDFMWIDRLAQWQANRSTSEIDPSIRTNSQRAAFSRGLRRAGDYIGITLRISKHDPKRRPGH